MKQILLLLLTITSLLSHAQKSQNIFTQDVNNFWIAYDSIRSTTNKEQQINFINRLYIDKASEGLKAFLKNKQNVDSKWVDLINSDQPFWDSIRPKTMLDETEVNNIQSSINYLRTLYLNLKDAASYFIIGFRQQGGTVRNNLSIIGTEVIVSEPNAKSAELTRICVHEYVHTQQIKPDFRNINVLTSSIREGACDFISQLVLKQDLSLPYIKYGLKNEVRVWSVFSQDMLTSANDWWVSTGDNPALPAKDLGYFVGYAICKSFYQNAADKKEAIRQIIELDYTSQKEVQDFLEKSGYDKYILAKGYNPSKKLEAEGYVSIKNKTVFQLNIKKRTIITDDRGSYQVYDEKKLGAINTISVAGDFNNWDTNDTTYRLRPNKSGQYTLSVDSVKLGKTGSKTKFRFLINNKYWVVPSFAVSNRIIDKDGNTDLFIQL